MIIDTCVAAFLSAFAYLEEERRSRTCTSLPVAVQLIPSTNVDSNWLIETTRETQRRVSCMPACTCSGETKWIQFQPSFQRLGVTRKFKHDLFPCSTSGVSPCCWVIVQLSLTVLRCRIVENERRQARGANRGNIKMKQPALSGTRIIAAMATRLDERESNGRITDGILSRRFF